MIIRGPFIAIGNMRGASGPTRTTQGLIYKTDFEDFSSWVNDGTFSKVADDALIYFDKLPVNFQRTIGGLDTEGVRNCNPFMEGSTLYMFYDGNSGVSRHSSRYATSTNGGKTWTKHGPLFDLSKGGGGLWTEQAMGWVGKLVSKYYFHRIVNDGTVDNANYPYTYSGTFVSDTWSADSLAGPWTYVGEIPLTASSFADVQCMVGSMVKNSSTYYLFIQGLHGAEYKVGYMTANSPDGPWTLNTTALLTATILGDSRQPENPKVFYHPILGKYVLLTNLIAASGLTSDQAALMISSSVSDWSTASVRRTRGIDAMGGVNCTGIGCVIYKPDGDVLIGSNNFIPIYFDHSGTYITPSWHWKRTISTSLMEPSRNALRFDGSALGKLWMLKTNSDFVAEFGIYWPVDNASYAVGFYFRADGASTNHYVLVLQSTAKLSLIKRVSSSNTTLQNGSASQNSVPNMINRIKVVANGTSLKAYLNGQLQIDVTDSAFSTGNYIGFYGSNGACDVRLLSFRSSDSVIFNGLPEDTEVELMADGGIIAAVGLANASGVATITLNHWPMESYKINGVNYTVSGGIYGGDTFDCSKLTLPAIISNVPSSAEIQESASYNVVVTFPNAISEDAIPDASYFNIGRTISGVYPSGSTIVIVSATPFIPTDDVTVTYTRGNGNVIRSAGTTIVKSFTSLAVTNNTTLILYDTFTDTNAVHLHDHTMNLGTGWTAPTDLTISSNAVTSAASAGAASYAVAESGIADVDITAEFNVPNQNAYFFGITFRYIDDTQRWRVFIQRSFGSSVMKISLNNGSEVTKVDITHAAGVKALRVTASGQTITAYWDGVQKIQITNGSLYTTATKHGLFFYRDAEYQWPVPTDNFSVNSL